ncbi:MAG: hypothetical protein LQ346_007377 [Caloplaca aetnensis]|nr:MAG: hypothetical protein LQ346_007377 [Caloplaca aetnensis]
MGYGFSLFKNPSDHCNIALGAMAIASIKEISHRRKFTSASKIPCRAKGFSSKTTMDVPLDHSSSGIGWVRLVPSSRDVSHLETENIHLVFPEGFLQQASIAFFNTRERLTGIPLRDAKICSTELTRNRLHTLSAIALILQKQYSDLIASNVNLPPWPRNLRQFHAARYRRGQLHILRSASSSIVAGLRRIAGLNPSSPRDKRIMRLEQVLKTPPKDFLCDFRAAIHLGLGTRDAEKLKRQDLAESAFVLWLCGLWLWSLPNPRPGGQAPIRQNLPARTARWLAFVHANYGDDSEIGRRWSALPASEEGRLLTESHHCIVKAAAGKNRQSIYSHPEATEDRLLWCLRVIREESFVSPNLEGKVGDETDEIILFLEEDITFTEAY